MSRSPSSNGSGPAPDAAAAEDRDPKLSTDAPQPRDRDEVRDCPRCWVVLDPVVLSSRRGRVKVEADRCPLCRGIFLDPDEVARVTGHPNLGEVLTRYLDFDYDSLLVCPDCGNQMEAKDAAGVEVDVCMACTAVWLDQGELTALARADPSAFLLVDDDGSELEGTTREAVQEVAAALQETFSRVLRRAGSRLREAEPAESPRSR